AIGSLFGVTAALAIGLRAFLGTWLNRFGRRPFIIGAGVLHVGLCLVYWVFDRLTPFLYVVRALHGIVEAIIFSMLFTYAADIVPVSRRTEGLALFGVSGQVPIALSGLAGEWLLARAGYHELFLVTAIFAALGLLLSLPLPEPEHAFEAAEPRGWVACATHRELVPLWFIGVAFATAVSPVFVFLKTYVMDTGVGSVGLFLALYSLSAATLRLFFGWVPDRVGPKKALAPAILAVACGMWLMAHASGTLSLTLAGMLVGAGHGLAFPIIVGLVVGRVVPAERAVAMSLATSIFDMGQLIGGPLFGAIIEARSYATAFVSAGVIAATGLVVFTLWEWRLKVRPSPA
ncbi:MAG: MFS transporter, partial [Gemmatimonadaceae bacterium]